MRMLGTGIDIEVVENRVAELGLGKHALDGVLKNRDGLLVQLLLDGAYTLSARITRVVDIVLLIHLVACELDLLSIDNDHVVTTVAVGGETRLALATKDHGNLRGKTAENLAFSVDNIPFLVGILFVDAYSL